jgi:hypothetical protein
VVLDDIDRRGELRILQAWERDCGFCFEVRPAERIAVGRRRCADESHAAGASAGLSSSPRRRPTPSDVRRGDRRGCRRMRWTTATRTGSMPRLTRAKPRPRAPKAGADGFLVRAVTRPVPVGLFRAVRKPEEPAMSATPSFVSIARARPRVVAPSHVYCIPVVRELPAAPAPVLSLPLTW